MEQIIRTVLGAQLQTSQLLGLPLIVPEHSTLNERFNIHSNQALADTDKPTVKYVGIGNGGHKAEIGGDGFSKIIPVPHLPRHAALYNQLPFVLRTVDNDLTPSERAKYRLRRSELHDGVPYIAYYLKVLDLSNTVPQLELRTVDSGVTTVVPFTPSNADLNPTKPAITSGSVLQTSGDYVAATAKVPFILSESDISAFVDVCNIIYGDPGYAFISEVALCSGVDKVLTGDFGGTSASYTDAIAVQVVNFISTSYAANFITNEIKINLNVGSVEPLLTIV